MDQTVGEVTRLVERWSSGDPTALDRLIELAYDDLCEIASRRLNGWRENPTLQTTVLVHELYMRLAGVREAEWGGRSQFFAFCSKAMRRILLDFARRRGTAKRGGDRVQVPLEDADASVAAEAAELVALDEALEMLATRNERMAQIVECRFFGGLSVPETAVAVGVSNRTVEREWARARAFLQYALSEDGAADPEGSTGGAA
ncbi:MAG TPA: ECF-type sigma factor [Longimicrobiales bacterium]|nr:ECF-type sigma factor [Longimicrobiales bacterium]